MKTTQKEMFKEKIEEYLLPIQGEALGLASKIRSISMLIEGFKPERELNQEDFTGLGLILEEIANKADGIYSALDTVNLPKSE